MDHRARLQKGAVALARARRHERVGEPEGAALSFALSLALSFTLCIALSFAAAPVLAAQDAAPDGAPGTSPAAGPPVAAALISVAALKERLQAADPPLLLDTSPGPAYAARHIAGAVHVDFFAYGARDAAPPERERWLQGLGLTPGRKVVIYDQGGTYFAPRLFYELAYSGVPVHDMVLLDGGLTRWQAEGGAVTAERPAPPPRGTLRAGALREDLRVRLDEFLRASGDTERHALVDALGPEYYFGQAKFFDRGGHVPHARLWPAEDFFNADKTFKSPAEIRRMAAWLGIRDTQTVYAHCGGGGAAAVPFFALRFLAGFPQVKLYRESQMEWLRDERGLPFWTYAMPSLRREAPWLDTWGSAMMRMLGLAGLSVVDVRPAASHGLGHPPFALNVPAETFRSHATQPAVLTAALGAAGVNAGHEAVIVSEGGLNARSALAFVLLRHLGQARVSLLAESVDEWGLKGFALTKQPTVVGTPRSPQDLAVPASAYAARSGTGMLLADARAGTGPHPRVWVAAGREPPARRPEGAWLHLPHALLVNADGSLKPAPEMWRAIAKAGVPRYAEIVSFADDPGEAAMNAVALQLMGFGDVKLWWP